LTIIALRSRAAREQNKGNTENLFSMLPLTQLSHQE